MQTKTTLASALATGAICCGLAQGALYNVDFYGGDDKGLMSGAAATGSAGDTWNNIQGGFGATTVNDLVDSTGATIVGTSISIDGNSSWSSFAGDGTYGTAEALMRDYIITGPSVSSTVTITVAEASSAYTLYLYGVTNFAPQDTTFTVVGANEGPQTVTSPDTSGPLTVVEDYVVFTGTTDGSGTIQIDYTGGSSFSAFDGLQLDVVPEPSTFTLFGMVSLGLLRRRR
ncbi:MAG: PEP-CTERM sorting domain-containing protein [Verrucomicrobiota bacterium]